MAWSDAARAAAAEARRRHAATPSVAKVGGKRVRLRAMYRTATTHIPGRTVRVGGKLVKIKAISVLGFMKYK